MSVISWFEIPVRDMDRAARFYERVLGTTLKREIFNGTPNALFTRGAPGETGGALIADPKIAPGTGSLVYLSAPDLDAAVARVPDAGGRVALPKTDIGAPGFIAIVVDTEGNRVGLHAPLP